MNPLLLSLFLSFGTMHYPGYKPGDIVTLKGYFLISSFDSSLKSPCGLDVPRAWMLAGDSITCGDGNFYGNIAGIHFLRNIDLKKIASFEYRLEIQKYMQNAYLTVSPYILLDASGGDSSILKNNTLAESIRDNSKTAVVLQQNIERMKPDFRKNQHYYLLFEVSVKAMVLPDRPDPTRFGDPTGREQYVILHNKRNRFKALKVINTF